MPNGIGISRSVGAAGRPGAVPYIWYSGVFVGGGALDAPPMPNGIGNNLAPLVNEGGQEGAAVIEGGRQF